MRPVHTVLHETQALELAELTAKRNRITWNKHII